jgi:hypothetical protein
MADQVLIDWIKRQKTKGYSSQQLYNFVIKRGYDLKTAGEAINFVDSELYYQPTYLPEEKNTLLLIMIGIGVLIVSASLALYIFYPDLGLTFGPNGMPEFTFTPSNNTNATPRFSEGNNTETNLSVYLICGGMDCFNEKFRNCEKANVTTTLTSSVIYYYEIIGPADGFCQIKSISIANPNSDWVGKEMDCNYNNSNDFINETSEILNSFITASPLGNCTGELYTLIIAH